MLRADANPNQSRGEPPQVWQTSTQFQRPRKGGRLGSAQDALDYAVLNQELQSLRSLGGKFPPLLHLLKKLLAGASSQQRRAEYIRSRDRVLYG
jgi:hypothetical protein